MYPDLAIRRRRARGPFYEDDEAARPLAPVVTLPEARPVRMLEPAPIVREAMPTTPVAMPAEPPPLVTSDRRGRPRLTPGIPTTDRPRAEQELMGALESYEPQKRSKLRMIGLSALRGLAAGPGGALSGALYGAGAAFLDPTLEDRQWKAGEIAASQGRQQQMRATRREGLQDELLQAQVMDERAQAEARSRPARPRLNKETMEDGTTILTQETAPGVFEPALRNGEPVVLSRRSRVPVNVPGVGTIEADANAALGYYGQLGRREEDREQGITKARVSLSEAEAAERENLQQRAAATNELNRLRAARQSLKPKSVSWDGKIDDPDYWAQVDALEAQIKDAEVEVTRRQRLADEAGTEARKLRADSSGRPRVPPPPPGVSEASIRAEAKRRGANDEEAVRRAKEFGWIR